MVFFSDFISWNMLSSRGKDRPAVERQLDAVDSGNKSSQLFRENDASFQEENSKSEQVPHVCGNGVQCCQINMMNNQGDEQMYF